MRPSLCKTRNPPILPPFSAIFKDGTDPAKIKKSISQFASYGKRNKESLAELFITLLIKLSSVEKLWPKGLCASACNAHWTSKTWGSKVACMSVEDFTDPAQNVARAVGLGEVKQIYKCIDFSLRYIFAFVDGQIGVLQLKELLFRPNGKTISIPRAILNKCPPIAASPRIQGNQSGRGAAGKRRRQAMCNDLAAPPNRIMMGAQSGGWGQGVHQQNMAPESISVKKMRADDAWREMPGGSWGAERQQSTCGWDRVHAGGWGGSDQAGTGGCWGGTQIRPHEGGGGSWGTSLNLNPSFV